MRLDDGAVPVGQVRDTRGPAGDLMHVGRRRGLELRRGSGEAAAALALEHPGVSVLDEVLTDAGSLDLGIDRAGVPRHAVELCHQQLRLRLGALAFSDGLDLSQAGLDGVGLFGCQVAAFGLRLLCDLPGLFDQFVAAVVGGHV